MTKKEKKYLENVIRPFKDKVKSVEKMSIATADGNEYTWICIMVSDEKNESTISLPYFETDKYYNGLRADKLYTLEDLGLFQTKYKITLSEFWNSKDKLAIHCDTEEKVDKLLKAFDKLGKKWVDNRLYLDENCYKIYTDKSCYTNDNAVGEFSYFLYKHYIVYEFDEVDLEN